PVPFITDEQRKGFGSVSVFYCPTRRSPPAYLSAPSAKSRDGSGSGGRMAQYWHGPQIDYAMVMSGDRDTGSGWHDFVARDRIAIKGPFRQSPSNFIQDDIRVTEWAPRDTLAWLSDGTSNQLLFGEKFFSHTYMNSQLGLCDDIADDCSYLGADANGTNVTALARTFDDWGPVGGPIALPNETTGNPPHRFGTAHPGVCNFLVGDGSVHAISATTPQFLLLALAIVNDGEAVSLP
ncbi:MAG: DUF1559 domain-containing protein, partial [Planctomycetaceae bacterium]|nr:DUF1559 domain-containing protein [Planctomycetaceae bacterium]